MTTQTQHVFISGFVQGIGYRKWLKCQARHLGIVGWVKNREDGAVEALVQGETNRVEQLIANVRKGPMLARVTTVETVPAPYDKNMSDFIVIQ